MVKEEPDQGEDVRPPASEEPRQRVSISREAEPESEGHPESESSDQDAVRHERRVRHPAAPKPRQRVRTSKEVAPELEFEEEVEVVSEETTEEAEVVPEIVYTIGTFVRGVVCVWADEFGAPSVFVAPEDYEVSQSTVTGLLDKRT